MLYNGSTLIAETNTSALTGFSYLLSYVPSLLTFTSSASYFAYFTVIRTSLETGAL